MCVFAKWVKLFKKATLFICFKNKLTEERKKKEGKNMRGTAAVPMMVQVNKCHTNEVCVFVNFVCKIFRETNK